MPTMNEVHDATQDFMSSHIKLIYLAIILTTIGPAVANAILKFLFLTTNPKSLNYDKFLASSDSLKMLTEQWYMQLC